MKRTVVFLHADRDYMFDIGKRLGLSSKALRVFSHTCGEVQVELSVDESTGVATIVSIDNRLLEKETSHEETQPE